MTEIEKMFENAGIKKLLYCDICKAQEHSLGLCAEIQCDTFYPPFTSEKQLEIIKFLFNHSVSYDVDSKGKYWFHISDDCYTYYYDKFEIALANIINEMWQSLTDKEKEEIRNILK